MIRCVPKIKAVASMSTLTVFSSDTYRRPTFTCNDEEIIRCVSEVHFNYSWLDKGRCTIKKKGVWNDNNDPCSPPCSLSHLLILFCLLRSSSFGSLITSAIKPGPFWTVKPTRCITSPFPLLTFCSEKWKCGVYNHCAYIVSLSHCSVHLKISLLLKATWIRALF